MRLMSATAMISLFLLEACRQSPEVAPAEGSATVAADPRTSGLFVPLPQTVDADARKVALGRRLYHDTGLSGDGTLACASCHSIADGGDDGLVVSPGIGGAMGTINSPTVLNAGLNFVQFWDGRAANLEEQAAGPVTNPVEMGAEWPNVLAYLRSDQSYVAEFSAIYPDGITQAAVTNAIAEFESTLITPSRYDAWLRGDDNALTAEEQAGFALFNEIGCQACHNGVNLGGASYQKMGSVRDYFAERGTPLTDADNGRFNVTQNESDRHFFKVPTLRNVALTAPYFHDGAAETLDEAVATMARVNLGRDLDATQVASIVTFLNALSGEIPDVALPVVARPRLAEGSAEGSGEGSGSTAGAAPTEGSANPL